MDASYSQSLTFDIVPEPAVPGVNDKTFDAAIFIDSFIGAFGNDRSFAFFNVKPDLGPRRNHSICDIISRFKIKIRSKGLEQHSLTTSKREVYDILASSEAVGETKVSVPSKRVFDRKETVIT